MCGPGKLFDRSVDSGQRMVDRTGIGPVDAHRCCYAGKKAFMYSMTVHTVKRRFFAS